MVVNSWEKLQHIFPKKGLRYHQIRLWISNISINTQGLGNQVKLLPDRATKRSLADIFNFSKQSAPAPTFQTLLLESLRKKCVRLSSVRMLILGFINSLQSYQTPINVSSDEESSLMPPIILSLWSTLLVKYHPSGLGWPVRALVPTTMEYIKRYPLQRKYFRYTSKSGWDREGLQMFLRI